jgi:hypothetical protein
VAAATPSSAPSPGAAPSGAEPAVVPFAAASGPAAEEPPAPERPVAPGVQTQASAEWKEDCWDWRGGRSFSGTTSTSGATGSEVILEQIGRSGAHRIVRSSTASPRVCMVAEDVGDRHDRDEPPSRWLARAPRVMLETAEGRERHRLVIDRRGGPEKVRWEVNGASRPFDAAAQTWRDDLTKVLDTIWEISALHGQITSLHGQITSVHGQETSLRGQITSLHGEVTSMQGRITSVRGEETSMRGRITSIHGHETSLRGQITSARGAITSLNSPGYRETAADQKRIAAQIAQHEADIERVERAIREYDAAGRVARVEREIKEFDADGQVAAIEREIRNLDVDGKVAAIERQIAELDVSRKVTEIQRQIERLEVDKRMPVLERRLEQERAQLRATIGRVR